MLFAMIYKTSDYKTIIMLLDFFVTYKSYNKILRNKCNGIHVHVPSSFVKLNRIFQTDILTKILNYI